MITRSFILVLFAACAPAPTPLTSSPTPPPAPPAPPATTDGPICGTRGATACPADQFCSYEIGADCGATDRPGHCMTRPQLCPHMVKPVCACDGKTYNNGCEASRAGTGLAADGACRS